MASAYIPVTTTASSSCSSTATTNTANTTPWQSPEPATNRTAKRLSASSTSSAASTGLPSSLNSSSSVQKANTWSSSPGHRTRVSLTSKGVDGHLSMSMGDAVATSKRSQPVPTRPKKDSVGKDQWWENVVPPGQLAERLRRAQEATTTCIPSLSSTSANLSGLVPDDRAPRHSRRTSRRTDSASGISQSSSMDMSYLCPPTSSSVRARAGTSSSLSSSLASHPTSSTRSSISLGDASSAASSDESSSERRSPLFDEWAAYSVRERSSGTTSPTGVTRSQSSRRCRVVGGEEGVGLGVSIRGAKSNTAADLDERLRQWKNGLPFHPSHSTGQPEALGLRPFPSSASSRSTVSATLLYSDPSSEEDEGRRGTRTSSTRSTNTLREAPRTMKSSLSRASAPPTRRSSLSNHGYSHAPQHHRHVSFNKDVEVVQADDVKRTQTIGRAHGRTMSAIHTSKTVTDRPAQRFSSHASRFAAQQDADVKAHAHAHVRGKRMPCYSAPTSPQLTTISTLEEHSTKRTSFEAARKAETSQNADNDHPEAQLAILSTLVGGHAHLSSARSLAATLTRQLSAPLRPILHMTLLASISSMAFMALTGFLIAGYLCTVWDDVNSRGKSLHRNVNSARTTLESRVHWTRDVLGISQSEASSSVSEEKATSSPSRHHHRAASQSPYKMLTAPLRFAFAIPAAFAYNMTPDSVRNAFSASSNEGPLAGRRASGRRPSAPSGTSGKHSMPPRPPLSSLLPSIAFTIVIAFGAGMASFFANRAASGSASSSGTSSGARTASNSATSSPPMHKGRPNISGRFDGTQVRRHGHHTPLNSDDLSASLRQLHERRSPYIWQDVTTTTADT